MESIQSAKNSIKIKFSVYAVISGVPIELPEEAKYVVQDKRGCWFHAQRKPRPDSGDWSANKVPIQLISSKGELLPKVLITPVSEEGWQNTVQQTIRR